MKDRIRSHGIWVAALALIVGLGVAVAFAENIDPFDTGDQYAWGENVGWLNAEPANCSGCGVEVSDTALTGYMWGENIGWVNLSCTNPPDTCGTVSYGVTNDGAGNLAGYAWGENVGWVSFDCSNTGYCGTVDYGVTINTATGEFSGYAWGENIGWISFSCSNTSSCGTVDYGAVTSWCADGDTDGWCDSGDNCPGDYNPGQDNTDFDLNAEGVSIYGGFVPADADGDECDDDDDNDSPAAFPNDWTDAKEALIGTDSKEACNRDPTTDDVWPPDTRALLSASERDNEVTGVDILPLKAAFLAVDGVDLNYDPRVDWSGLFGSPDGQVTGFDLLPFKHAFGATCSVP